MRYLKKGFSPVLIPLLILFSLVFLFVYSLSTKPSLLQSEKPVESSVSDLKTPSPTPFLFEELTIPYLRDREYNSELQELSLHEENSTYTSYLTSYISDGLKINGLLTIPKGPAPRSREEEVGWPAIVFVHGYIAPNIYKTTERYVDHVNYLARNGFVVFKIDLRGHGTSEGEAGGAYYSEDYVVDTLNAYAALEGADFVNKKKIGLWGHSMAGNIVLRSFVVKKNMPGAVIWAGAGYTYSDLQKYRIDDNSYRPPPTNSPRARERQRLREAYGDFDANSEFWKKVPATNYLDGVTGNLELHHSVDDNVVSIEYSRNLVNILKNSALSARLFEYQSGGHNISGGSFTTAMQRTVEFFKKNL